MRRNTMDRSWMPKVAGILAIVAGSLSIVVLISAAIGAVVFVSMRGADIPMRMPLFPAIVVGLGIPLLVLDILAIIGGVFALKKKSWGLSLAGSIAAVFGSWLLGIAAIVFIALSRNEFKSKSGKA
jgi:uncharacterized membrane protein